MKPAIAFSLLRGCIFLVPSFLLLPSFLGNEGIWLALGLSELLTLVCALAYSWSVRQDKGQRIQSA